MVWACKSGGRTLALFLFGGAVYAAIELAWRGRTHWTMALLGGALFLVIGLLNEGIGWDSPLPIQAVLGAVVVTGAELCAGVVLNLWLGLGIWDYAALPLNLCGQICLGYSLLWVPLSIVAVVLDDWLRHWLFGEERPHYHLIGHC